MFAVATTDVAHSKHVECEGQVGVPKVQLFVCYVSDCGGRQMPSESKLQIEHLSLNTQGRVPGSPDRL